MKLTVDSKSLVEAIGWVTKSFDSKDSTAYVALRVDKKGSANLLHANSTSFMKAKITVLDAVLTDSELASDDLSLALNGQFLQQLAGVLSKIDGAIELSYDFSKEKTKLDVKTGNGKFTIPMLETKPFKEPAIIELGEIDDREYFDSLQRLAKLCESASAGFLPVLGSVDIKLDVEGKKIVMMATDRYALGEITVDFDPSSKAGAYTEENPNVLLPVECATLIAPSKGLTSSTTLIHETRGKKFGYRFGDSRVALFALKDAEPLAYTSLKTSATENVKNSFRVSTSELRQAIGNISNLTWDENDIILKINEDGLVVSDTNGQNKMSVEVEDIDLEEECTVRFVRSIINKAFSPISTSSMNVKWESSESAFIFEPVLEDGTAMDNVFVFLIPSA